MAIAWSTLIVLVLLIPGLVAVFGVYVSDKVSRDVVPQTLLPQLAVLITVSVFVHSVAYLLLNKSFHHEAIPQIDLAVVSSVPSIGNNAASTYKDLVKNIDTYAWWIATYFIVTAVAGFWLGRLFGYLIAKGPLRALAVHSWLYDTLICAHKGDRSKVRCYVLSNVEHNGARVIYFGTVYHFQFSLEGKLSYLVLADASRGLLMLNEGKIRTVGVEENIWSLMPERIASATALSEQKTRPSLLFIEGDYIANVFFTSQPWQVSKDDLQSLEQKVQAKAKEENVAAGSSSPLPQPALDRTEA
jgi:hypothetical protein